MPFSIGVTKKRSITIAKKFRKDQIGNTTGIQSNWGNRSVTPFLNNQTASLLKHLTRKNFRAILSNSRFRSYCFVNEISSFVSVRSKQQCRLVFPQTNYTETACIIIAHFNEVERLFGL
jgi:hypothetical protein